MPSFSVYFLQPPFTELSDIDEGVEGDFKETVEVSARTDKEQTATAVKRSDFSMTFDVSNSFKGRQTENRKHEKNHLPEKCPTT